MMDERELHARYTELFQRVVDLDSDAREEILAEEMKRSGGPLVVQRVRAALAVNAESDTEQPLDADSLLGHQIKEYEVVEILDRGGMGVVYRARRLEPMEEVAIKVLSTGPMTADVQERFHLEVKLLASCDHPGIVRYRDSGELVGGRPFLIMDLIDGEPLSLDEPAIHAGACETVELMIQAAEAVQHLHARLAVHRDLKPTNLLITRGAQPRPILIDLGIARELAEDEQEVGPTQLAGLVLGTPAFMSPEQFLGRVPLAPADVYGLGAVLFYLLTGVPPRDLHEVPNTDVEERRRRLLGPAHAPSTRVQEDVFRAGAAARTRHIEGDLDAVVLKALESDPNDRYGSVEALRADLSRWVDGRPVKAFPIGWRGRTWRAIKRHPRPIAAGALLFLILAGFSFVTWRSLVNEREAKADLQVAKGAVEEQLGTTSAINDLVKNVFQQASPELRGPDAPVGEIVEAAADAIGPDLEGRPAIAVGMRSSLIVVFSTMGNLERAHEQVELARPLAAELPLDHPQRMEYDVQVGLLAQHERRAADAIAILSEVVPRVREAELVSETLLPRAVTAYAMALMEDNQLAESLRLHREAIELMPADNQAQWSLRANVCSLVQDLEGPAAAIPDLEALLARMREEFHDKHVYIMMVGTALASNYLDEDQPEKAVPLAREALAIANETYPADSPDRLTVLGNYASALSRSGEFEQAVPLRKEVYETRVRLFGADSPPASLAAVNYSTSLSKVARHLEAVHLARLAVDAITAQGRLAHPDAGYAYQALGVALGGTGEVSEALDALARAIEILDAAQGNFADRIATIEREMARLRARQ